MQLTESVRLHLTEDSKTRNLLAAELGKSESTIRRWIATNSIILTTEASLRIIEQETGLKRNKIITK